MKVVSLNVNDMGNAIKWKQIKEVILKVNTDIAMLQEARKRLAIS